METENILAGLSSTPKKKREVKAFFKEDGEKVVVPEKSQAELLYEVIAEEEAEVLVTKEMEEDFAELIESVEASAVITGESAVMDDPVLSDTPSVKPKRKRGPKRNPLPYVKRTMCTTLIESTTYDTFRELLKQQGRKISDTVELMIKDFIAKHS